MTDRLERVQTDVRTLQDLVSNIRTGPEYMDELARTMDASEADISALKEEQQDRWGFLHVHLLAHNGLLRMKIIIIVARDAVTSFSKAEAIPLVSFYAAPNICFSAGSH